MAFSWNFIKETSVVTESRTVILLATLDLSREQNQSSQHHTGGSTGALLKDALCLPLAPPAAGSTCLTAPGAIGIGILFQSSPGGTAQTCG